MRRMFARVAVALLLSCGALAAASTSAAGDDVRPGVTYVDGMLSVSANNVTLGSLLDDIAAKAKIAVHVADEVKGLRVSPRYADLTIKEGLVRILEEAGLNSYLLVYGDREQKTVRELFVMKGEKALSGSTTTPTGRTAGQPPTRSDEMPGTRMSPPVPPMVPIPMTPPVSEEFPEPPPPPFPPAQEQEEMPPAVPPPLPPTGMNEVYPPPPPVLP